MTSFFSSYSKHKRILVKYIPYMVDLMAKVHEILITLLSSAYNIQHSFLLREMPWDMGWKHFLKLSILTYQRYYQHKLFDKVQSSISIYLHRFGCPKCTKPFQDILEQLLNQAFYIIEHRCIVPYNQYVIHMQY